MIPQQSKKTQHFYLLSRWLSQQISLGQMMHTKSKPPRYTYTQIVTILIVLLSILLQDSPPIDVTDVEAVLDTLRN